MRLTGIHAWGRSPEGFGDSGMDAPTDAGFGEGQGQYGGAPEGGAGGGGRSVVDVRSSTLQERQRQERIARHNRENAQARTIAHREDAVKRGLAAAWDRTVGREVAPVQAQRELGWTIAQPTKTAKRDEEDPTLMQRAGDVRSRVEAWSETKPTAGEKLGGAVGGFFLGGPPGAIAGYKAPGALRGAAGSVLSKLDSFRQGATEVRDFARGLAKRGSRIEGPVTAPGSRQMGGGGGRSGMGGGGGRSVDSVAGGVPADHPEGMTGPTDTSFGQPRVLAAVRAAQPKRADDPLRSILGGEGIQREEEAEMWQPAPFTLGNVGSVAWLSQVNRDIEDARRRNRRMPLS